MLNGFRLLIASIRENLNFWNLIVAIVLGALTVFLFYQQNTIAAQNLALTELQVSNGPTLYYTVVQFGDSGEQADIEAAQRELENRNFEAIASYVQSNPGTSYSEALDAVLPMTVTVPFKPSGVCVLAKNEGRSTANRVRVTVSLDAPIGDVKYSTTEILNIIAGGRGENSVTVEIDRITTGKLAEVFVTLQSGGENVGAQLDARRQGKKLDDIGLTTSWFPSLTTDRPAEVSNYVANLVTFTLLRPLSITPDVSVTSNEVTGSLGESVTNIQSCSLKP